MAEKKIKSHSRAYALVVLVIVSVAYEHLRAYLPLPRNWGLTLCLLVHRLTVFVVVSLIWHWYNCWAFRTRKWGTGRTFATPLVVSFTIVAIYFFDPPAKGWHGLGYLLRPGLEFLFNTFLIPVYTYLGLYSESFIMLLVFSVITIAGIHLLREQWSSRGRIYDLTGKLLTKYLTHNPEGLLYHAWRTVHWEIFGRTLNDPQYETTLERMIASRQYKIDRERIWGCVPRLFFSTPLGHRVTLHYTPLPIHKLKANLAFYLRAPMTDGGSSIIRYLKASEIYYEIKVSLAPESCHIVPEEKSTPASSQEHAAPCCIGSCKRCAGIIEEELYGYLLGCAECTPLRTGERLSFSWDLALRVYSNLCRWWMCLPPGVKELLVLPEYIVGKPHREILSDRQHRLTSFLLNPPNDIQELIAVLQGIDVPDVISKRLIWLSLAKWMERVEGISELYHERLIDGYYLLRQLDLPSDFWGADTVFEAGPAGDNWVKSLCLSRLGIAWLSYWSALGLIKGNSVARSFAARQSLSVLVAANAREIINGIPVIKEVLHAS